MSQPNALIVAACLAAVVSCSDPGTVTEKNEPAFGADLHPRPDVEVRKSSDDLERAISVYSEEWLGDRYSDPKLTCEASSADRILRFVAKSAGKPIAEIQGSSHLPKGTYHLSFGDRTWSTKEAIFDGVRAALEEVFRLDIAVVDEGDTRTLIVKPRA